MEHRTLNCVAVMSIGDRYSMSKRSFFWLTIWIKRPSGMISLNRSLVLFTMVALASSLIAMDIIAQASISQLNELSDATIC
jgi:hypothetical protein